jgi:hypothetical protein
MVWTDAKCTHLSLAETAGRDQLEDVLAGEVEHGIAHISPEDVKKELSAPHLFDVGLGHAFVGWISPHGTRRITKQRNALLLSPLLRQSGPDGFDHNVIEFECAGRVLGDDV